MRRRGKVVRATCKAFAPTPKDGPQPKSLRDTLSLGEGNNEAFHRSLAGANSELQDGAASTLGLGFRV